MKNLDAVGKFTKQQMRSLNVRESDSDNSWSHAYKQTAVSFSRLRGWWPINYKDNGLHVTQRVNGYRENWRNELDFVMGVKRLRPLSMGPGPYLLFAEAFLPMNGSWIQPHNFRDRSDDGDETD